MTEYVSVQQEDKVKETRERLTWLKEHTTPDCSKGFARFNIKNIESILAEIDCLQAENEELKAISEELNEDVALLISSEKTWKDRAEKAEASLKMLHGQKFSDRCYYALKSRAEKAEAELQEAKATLTRTYNLGCDCRYDKSGEVTTWCCIHRVWKDRAEKAEAALAEILKPCKDRKCATCNDGSTIPEICGLIYQLKREA